MLNTALLLLALVAPSAPLQASPAPAVQGTAPATLRSIAWADEPRVRAPAMAVKLAATPHADAELREPFGAPRRNAPVATPRTESLRDPFGPRRRVVAPAPAITSPPLRDPFG
jgi:hypothetical protein